VIWSFTEQLCDKQEKYHELNISLNNFVPERTRELNTFIDKFERERNEALEILIKETKRKQKVNRQSNRPLRLSNVNESEQIKLIKSAKQI
ncbi:hypothetical protein BU071_13320, partial [Mammaliicoccus vitulinus]